MNDNDITFFLVPAPGHYGDRAQVLSSHRTLAAAQRAARSYGAGAVVREGHKAKGQPWLRSYEDIYPLVTDQTIRCQSGEWSGEACQSDPMPRSDAIRIWFVPDYLRGTAQACGSWEGLAQRILVCSCCAEQMAEYDAEWTSQGGR